MFAYLDAGSVSVVLAAIAGGIAGIAVFFKMFWHRILGVFSPKHREKAKQAREEIAASKAADEAKASSSESTSAEATSPEPSSTKPS